ncbi:DUF1428 domain-containing protein [Sphingomonas sp.]|uniref:DUF1428 domain-containing protein n=1 Tax=Sphingomonas sp. TaxID=28214 RepID=UPI003B3A9C69
MAYIDGFVLPVKATDKQAYLDMARAAAPVFKEHGALRVVECWPDDVPRGERTDFYRAVDAQEGEIAVFSWIEWPSKAARDAGMKRVWDDPRLCPGEDAPPFDMKRMIVGGFAPILDA